MEMYQWLTAILVGGITGFVSHLINNQGKLLLPRRLKTFLLHQALGGEQAKNTQIGKADEKIQEIDKLLRR
ncbi:DUF4257 domain-containing protein [Bacillus anthracis]|uniref:DUF4257 domain-containing protein n=1 Tax=Bacillus anthracis TaxID=1392 RepID=UPI003B98692E